MTCPPHTFRVEQQGAREGGMSMGRCSKRGCSEERLMSNIHNSKWLGNSAEAQRRAAAVTRGNRASNRKVDLKR